MTEGILLVMGYYFIGCFWLWVAGKIAGWAMKKMYGIFG